MITIMQATLNALFDDGRTIHLGPNEPLFHAAAPCTHVHMVLDGRIDLIRHATDGRRLRLHSASPGQVVAEASVYSDSYHCDGVAQTEARVASVPRSRFLARLEEKPALARLWAATLARGLQESRMQSEIRALRTVSDRLDAWLSYGGGMPPKGAWQGLAESLGVSREALYREMARRRG